MFLVVPPFRRYLRYILSGERAKSFFMMQIRGKILHALNPISMETSEQRKNKIGGRHCVTFFSYFEKKTSNEAMNSSLN